MQIHFLRVHVFVYQNGNNVFLAHNPHGRTDKETCQTVVIGFRHYYPVFNHRRHSFKRSGLKRIHAVRH